MQSHRAKVAGRVITATEAEQLLDAYDRAKGYEAAVDRKIKEALTKGLRTARFDLPKGGDDHLIAVALADRYRSGGWDVEVKMTDGRVGQPDPCWLELRLPAKVEAVESAKRTR